MIKLTEITLLRYINFHNSGRCTRVNVRIHLHKWIPVHVQHLIFFKLPSSTRLIWQWQFVTYLVVSVRCILKVLKAKKNDIKSGDLFVNLNKTNMRKPNNVVFWLFFFCIKTVGLLSSKLAKNCLSNLFVF